MASTDDVLVSLAERFAFVSDEELRVDGVVAPARPASPGGAYGGALAPVRAMAERVYVDAYCRGEPTGPHRRPSRWSTEDLVEALSAANAGIGSRDRGWEIEAEVRPGLLRVRGYGVSLLAAADRVVRREGPGGSIVRVPKEIRWLWPDFYMALGNDSTEPDVPQTRVYWHVTEAAVVPVMAGITSILNAANVPFRFKTVCNPERMNRADAAVLYVQRATASEALARLRGLYGSVRPSLRPSTPLFTMPVAPGLAVADDTGIAEESFGNSRCRLVAEALWRARATDDVAARVDAVRARFAEAGLDVRRPYLGAADAPDYERVPTEEPTP